MKICLKIFIVLFGVHAFAIWGWCDNPTPTPVQEKQQKSTKSIPEFEEAYRKASDSLKQPGLDENTKTLHKMEKSAIAYELILLKDKDPQYKQYLLSLVEPLIDSDMPDPTVYDKNGKFIPNTQSKEFLTWCSDRGLDWKAELIVGYQEGPINLTYFAMMKDLDNVPLFLKGLKSPNGEVASISAKGLVHLNYKPAIQAIISSCRQRPKAERLLFAEYLLTFDDSIALAAGKELMPNKGALDYLLKMDIKKRRKFLVGE